MAREDDHDAALRMTTAPGSALAPPPKAAPPGRGRGLTPRGYVRLLALAPMVDLTYRFSSLVRILILATRAYLFYALWSAVYRPGQVVAGMNVHQAITYSVLAALQGWVQVGAYGTIERAVDDGSVVYFFLRPLSVLRTLFVQTLGGTLYGLLWLAAGAAIAWAAGLVMAPTSAAVALVYLLSTVLGQIVYYHVALLQSLTAFWIVRTTGLNLLYGFVVELLGGVLVPIWFFPGWLRQLSLWLPFQAMANTPLSLYVGRLPLSGAASDMAVQVLWCVVLAALARVIWIAAERRVVVQGG